MRLPRGLSPFRHRDFALYWVGQCVSQVGTFVELTATTYLLYAITGSPVLLGIGGLVRGLPILLLALFGGALADRIDRKRLLLVTQCSQVVTSLILGTLVITGAVTFWHIYLIGLVNATLSAFDAPARNSFYPLLIPRADFQNAVTLSSIILRLSTLLGPAVAGVLIATSGPATPFFVNAVSYFAIIGALLRIRTDVRPAAGPRASLRSAAWSGLRYARRSAILPLVLGTEAALSVFGHNTALITIFARDVLHVGPEGLGLLLSAVGGGAIAGSLVLVASGDVRRKGLVMVAAGLLYAVALLGFARSTSFSVSLGVLFVLGTADAFWGAMRSTIVQLAATDAYRGRMMALVTVASRGLTSAGQLETGALVALVGAPVAALLNGTLVGAAVLAAGLSSPRLRAFRTSAPLDLNEPASP